MKNSLIILLLLFGVLTGNSKTRVVENPVIGYNNVNYMDFPTVTLTDTATIIHAKVKFRPKWWISISPDSYLQTDNGEKYKIRYGKGIALGEEHYMDEKGLSEFDLIFEPVPQNSNSILFSEGPGKWTMKFSLNPESSETSVELPADISAGTEAGSIPTPVFAVDSATVNIHIIGYKPYMGNSLSLIIDQLGGQLGDLPPIKIDENGNGSYSTLLHGTGTIYAFAMGNVRVNGRATINPGETIDLFIDPDYSGQYIMGSLRGTKTNKDKKWSSHNGVYSAYDAAPSFLDAVTNLYSGEFGDYRMGADEFVDYAVAQYEINDRKIKATDSISAITKAKAQLNNKVALVAALAQYQRILKMNYRNVKKDFDYSKDIPSDSITCELLPENYQIAAEMVDLNDPTMAIISSFSVLPASGWSGALEEGTFLKEAGEYVNACQKIKSGRGSADDVESLKNLSNPFYAQSAQIYLNDIQKILADDASKLCLPTPEVSTDSIFDAIIAPHKGKVVMVDLWNTWCGPCRAALELHEPEKSEALSSDDIVWIYIADESSPLKKYYEMIPGIKGLHYRLTEDQISSIRKRFNVDGIPYYILVDRKGNAVGRPDLRNPELYKNTLIEALAESAE